MKLLLTFTLSFIILSCASQIEKPSKIITIHKSEYSFSYPSEWKIDTSNLSKAEFTISSPKENEDDRFSENVNLFVQNLKGQNMTLEKYVEISEMQIKKNAVKLKSLESKKLVTNDIAFYSLTFEMEYGNYNLKTIQHYLQKNDNFFVITFSSEIEKYELWKTIGMKILESFILTK